MRSKIETFTSCFHFWVSLRYNTTHRLVFLPRLQLWIAFIFEYLWDTTQSAPESALWCPGCELLSFLSIFGIQHNFDIVLLRHFLVVNCFHFWVSLGYNTMSCETICHLLSLWIAYIFEYLWDTTQWESGYYGLALSCELLSFLSIFGIQHNLALSKSRQKFVVNCFHFWVSLGYNTIILSYV